MLWGSHESLFSSHLYYAVVHPMSFIPTEYQVPRYNGPALKQQRLLAGKQPVNVNSRKSENIAIEPVPQESAPPVVSTEDVRVYVISIVGHLFSLIGLGAERSDVSDDEDFIVVEKTENAMDIFNCKEAPTIELGDYVWRIVRLVFVFLCRIVLENMHA